MGLGRFGGGVGLTRFLVDRGARVLVTDLAPADQLADSLEQISGLPVKLRLGEHRISDFVDADLIVVNPAADPRRNQFIAAALHANVPCTSEIRLLVQSLPSRLQTIGVTGTAGKSTVVAMIGHVLTKTLGTDRVHVGGNIGGSLLGQLDQINPDDRVVLELSSFMLEGLAADHWSPHIAVVTNVFANHLDRYDSFAGYVDAKRAILEYQQPDDVAVLDQSVADWPAAARKIVVEAAPRRDLLVPGDHNQRNAAIAERAAGEVLTMPTDLSQALTGFPGLPHRLQFVTERDGVRYFNDSKSTTPEAAILAIRSFQPGTVHVILGGYDKGADLNELAQCAADHCTAIYTIGATGPTVATACRAANTRAEVVPCETLAKALAAANQRTSPGQILLLSPACASWDQFDNFEQRAAAFIEAVDKHPR